MDNKKKIWRREQGEKWLIETYVSDYESVIDLKIEEHYNGGTCKKV